MLSSSRLSAVVRRSAKQQSHPLALVSKSLQARSLSIKSTSPVLSSKRTVSQTSPALPYATPVDSIFAPLDLHPERHIGPDAHETEQMLARLGYDSMDAFIAASVPESIRINPSIVSDETIQPYSDSEFSKRAREVAGMNKVFKSYIGMGYHEAVVPGVILRNVTENPAWYTSYTPYQPEIAQGRLESLVNYQTMVTSLTGLEFANASLLDEGTAAAEAMIMSMNAAKGKKTYIVGSGVLPQTLSVIRTRAKGFGVKIIVGSPDELLEKPEIAKDLCGILVQYPDVNGEIRNWESTAKKVHELGGKVSVATDLLALTLLKPPGEWGADMVLGNSARFGVPAGYGGPHAAFFSCKDALKRKMPGRIIGLSKGSNGERAYRLALQTREQHIRREKATSNICTAQALLANMAAMYAVYHGPEGLKRIATKVHGLTHILREILVSFPSSPYQIVNKHFFDTLTISVSSDLGAEALHAIAADSSINLRRIDEQTVGVTLDESVGLVDLMKLVNVFAKAAGTEQFKAQQLINKANEVGATGIAGEVFMDEQFRRSSPFLTNPVFNTHHSETEMLRYLYFLQGKDLSLVHSMIPLGSCTMKLNSNASMVPLTLPGFGGIHPFAPADQTKGYQELIKELEHDLAIVTGYHAVSLQPNSGAQGEFAGLLVIKAYFDSIGQSQRDICLVPVSAHGTNPASAVMAGMKVVSVKVLANGELDMADLRAKVEQHKDRLAAFMVTYPSTFGVFEQGVQEACQIVHDNGGQVYLDGANLNAQMGLTNPVACGSDVSHLNLHKTFGIPHGGGGPGVGPIGVREHLAPFLPGHAIVKTGGSQAIDSVSSAPWGSASILPISWAFIKMLGGTGLTNSAKTSILSANYIAKRLEGAYKLRFSNENGLVAHELLLDLAEFEPTTGLKVMDFAKRLQDFGIHPPTCSWPISTGMLIEPTESESLTEIDRFCDAMLQIRKEVQAIADGKQPKGNNVISHAPHTVAVLTLPDDKWNRPYTREEAVYPLPSLRTNKFWPTVGRIDDAFGDMNLVCNCPTVEELAIDIDA
ncbi:glycine dehydrogenase [Phaffia rhodozyma]|uniref:Glycine cleavage system P protein n=1 Tax=Phaffia rhodozyma TaxID=264483 RepID=A0A0F7SPZ1_PHARH|nr:glycine dehydrogenase [Phaffia rhodozyma]